MFPPCFTVWTRFHPPVKPLKLRVPMVPREPREHQGTPRSFSVPRGFGRPGDTPRDEGKGPYGMVFSGRFMAGLTTWIDPPTMTPRRFSGQPLKPPFFMAISPLMEDPPLDLQKFPHVSCLFFSNGHGFPVEVQSSAVHLLCHLAVKLTKIGSFVGEMCYAILRSRLHAANIDSYGDFLKWYPQIIHLNGMFPYKPSILGYPHWWNPPYSMLILENI